MKRFLLGVAAIISLLGLFGCGGSDGVPAPSISSVEPTGVIKGRPNQSVTINGANLSNVLNVAIDNGSVVSFTPVDSGKIYASVTGNSAGTGTITVTTTSGSCGFPFTVYPDYVQQSATLDVTNINSFHNYSGVRYIIQNMKVPLYTRFSSSSIPQNQQVVKYISPISLYSPKRHPISASSIKHDIPGYLFAGNPNVTKFAYYSTAIDHKIVTVHIADSASSSIPLSSRKNFVQIDFENPYDQRLTDSQFLSDNILYFETWNLRNLLGVQVNGNPRSPFPIPLLIPAMTVGFHVQ